MPQNGKNEKILVVSTGTELVEMVKKATEGKYSVLHAQNAQQGLEMARKEFPEMIALG
jgi:DNA-binding response OmpR family regulator